MPAETFDTNDSEQFQSGYKFLRGDAFHLGFQDAFPYHELPLKVDVQLSDGTIVTISGRLDYYTPYNGGQIIDLKSTTWLSWQDKNNHLPQVKDQLQLQIYNFMRNLPL